MAPKIQPKSVQEKQVEEKVKKPDVRKKRALAVGALVGPLVEPALRQAGMALAQIVPHWGAICPLLARYSTPESLRNETLTVAVASDAVKQELHYIAPQVVEGVNMLLGYAAVAKVRGITRPGVGKRAMTPSLRAAAPVDDRVKGVCKNVRDDGLRDALQKLGAQVAAKKK